MTSVQQWTVTIDIDAHAEWTHARAQLAAGTSHEPVRADGTTNHLLSTVPPVVGAELAVAQSLTSLAKQLVHAAHQRMTLPPELRMKY